jgi:hypothetical protein
MVCLRKRFPSRVMELNLPVFAVEMKREAGAEPLELPSYSLVDSLTSSAAAGPSVLGIFL